MNAKYLVVDVEAVLDQSKTGKNAAALLQKRMQEAEERAKGIKKQASRSNGDMARKLTEEATSLAQKTTIAVEDARFTLRTAVLNRAETALREISDERKTPLVLERKMVVLFDEKSDVTDEVIQRVDALGDLSL